MSRPSEHSSQHNNFCGVIGLLVVAGLWSAAMGSYFGLIVAGALLGILFTRAQWARIVSLVMVAYVGLVGLLAALFARGDASFRAMSFAAIAGAIFWLLLRPGMDRYFGVAQGASQVLPVAPRPGALPHLQNSRMAAPPVPAIKQTVSPVAQGSTQEQWTRLQQQLRAEQEKEEREAAMLEEPPERNQLSLVRDGCDGDGFCLRVIRGRGAGEGSNVGGDSRIHRSDAALDPSARIPARRPCSKRRADPAAAVGGRRPRHPRSAAAPWSRRICCRRSVSLLDRCLLFGAGGRLPT